MEEKEMTLEELENIHGGINRGPAEDKALENPNLYRQKKIEELKQEKEKLKETGEQSVLTSEEQGRSR